MNKKFSQNHSITSYSVFTLYDQEIDCIVTVFGFETDVYNFNYYEISMHLEAFNFTVTATSPLLI